jgi:hypothetical protein
MARGTRRSTEADKVNWKDEERVGYFADAIIAVMIQSGKQDLTFKSQEWTIIKDHFNSLANVNYDKIKLQTYMKNRKKDYHGFTYLKDQSGFGWIEDSFQVTAPDDVWEPILHVNPELKKWKGNGFWHFDKWSAIFDGRIATGAHAVDDYDNEYPEVDGEYPEVDGEYPQDLDITGSTDPSQEGEEEVENAAAPTAAPAGNTRAHEILALRQEGRKRSRVSTTDRIVKSFQDLASTIVVAAGGTTPAAFLQLPPPVPPPAVDSATQKRNEAWAILSAEPFTSQYTRKDLMKVKRVFIQDLCEAELFLQSDDQDRIFYVDNVLE